MRGSVHQAREHELERWSHGLYEKCWRCVIAFLRRLHPVWDILVDCWDTQKYHHAEKPEDEENDAEGDAGSRAFDAHLIGTTLKDKLFAIYIEFAMGADEIPETHLSSWGEGCECHEPFSAPCFGAGQGGGRDGECQMLAPRACPNISADK